MRLAFPNGEHEEVSLGRGSVSIGSSESDDIVLNSEGIRPGHATIIVDKRGVTLNIDDDSSAIQLNQRTVRKKAILRMGDSILINQIPMMLHAAADRISAPPKATLDMSDEQLTILKTMPAKFYLRGVAGEHFGELIPLYRRLVFGRGSHCDIVLEGDEISREHAAIENASDGVYLRDLGSINGTFVNGNQVRDAVLYPGDQIAFDSERYVLESPAYVPGKIIAEDVSNENETATTQVFKSPVMEDQDAKKSKPADTGAPRASNGGRTRDTIIIVVCVMLSIAMIVWVAMS